jgi:hypothetical protein
MKVRRLLLFAGFLTLILGVLAGLSRLGFSVGPAASLGAWHGALMSAGFAGLLISLERAVALERAWGYAAPALVLAGTLGLIAGLEAAPWAWVVAGAVAVAVQLRLASRRWDAASVVMALGTLAWALGLWRFASGADLSSASLAWIAFPALVIAGERLELAFQVRPGGAAWWAFLLSVALVLTGAFLASAHLEAPGLAGLSLWMLRYDVLKRGWAQGGLPRYMAAALWTGYTWLALGAGFLWAWGSGLVLAWDAALHSVFLGFMFAMIFAHAPVIFPAVSGLGLRWHKGHYAHLGLLSLALALRVAPALGAPLAFKRHGSLCAALALLIFLLNQAASALLARREPGALHA